MKTLKFRNIGIVLLGGFAIGFSITGCMNDTYEGLAGPVKNDVSYEADVKPIMQNNCVVCHNAIDGVENDTPLTTYDEVKSMYENNGLLDRVQKPAGDPDVMPQSGPLNATQIAILLNWKTGNYKP